MKAFMGLFILGSFGGLVWTVGGAVDSSGPGTW